MEKAYAEAIQNALDRGDSEKTVVEGLVRHLKATGRLKLLPAIRRELVRMEALRAKRAPRIEAASEQESTAAKRSAAALGIAANAVSVVPHLIVGWRAKSGSTLVDASAKTALLDLYRTITE